METLANAAIQSFPLERLQTARRPYRLVDGVAVLEDVRRTGPLELQQACTTTIDLGALTAIHVI